MRWEDHEFKVSLGYTADKAGTKPICSQFLDAYGLVTTVHRSLRQATLEAEVTISFCPFILS